MYNIAINGGGILAKSSSILISGCGNVSSNNADSGGGIYLYHSQMMFEGSTTLCNNQARNKGGGIHAVSSSILLKKAYRFVKNKALDYLYLTSNVAKEGGGLYLESSSKFHIVTTNKKVFIFRSNSALRGGAIYVADDTNSGTCTSSQKNDISESECFFQPIQVTPNAVSYTHLTLPTIYSV